ncbi:DUF4139 domain-containing protein [Dysgonomonas massiliensis]|uniref:DUF4139 domain-containing protein n=1 Tax=Dysgonomonas massiliensis TaxID=2040292 RepID=UPI000C75DC4B|nr:DUF4139 domain-containing protein [Dysgonomonas massiliensis]
MNTKISILILLIIVCTSKSFADTKPIKAELKEATVFFTGAELKHKTTSIQLKQGENNIVIEGISPKIDKNSLKIKASNGVLISSFEFSIDYLSEVKNKNQQTKTLQDSIDLYTEKVNAVNTEFKINNELADILKKSTDKNVSGSEKGLGIDELVKTMDYYKTKRSALEKVLSSNRKQIDKYNEIIERLTKQLKQESIKNNISSGILNLSLNSPTATNSTFEISYYTTDATWTPFYDINIPSTDKLIQIESKAKVRQITGLDWDKIKLTLSTATPSNGKVAPLFSTWFLEEVKAANNIRIRGMSSINNAMQNSYSYKEQNRLNFSQDTISQANKYGKNIIRDSMPIPPPGPIYIVDGMPMDADQATHINPNAIKNIEVLKDASATALYGSRAKDGVVLITLKDNMSDHIYVSDNDLNISYNIDLPFSVPGNGKEQSLTLKKDEIMADYKYYSAPKLNPETYLLAEIDNWEKLNLLNGKANITYDGTYVGESLIDASSTSKLLTLTLGSDNRVVVKREKMRDYSSTKFLGNDTQQIFTYNLTVKNNQNKDIKMVLKDQYPISTQKNIVVELIDQNTTRPTINKPELGVITWEETLKPGETKIYKISYSIKYPKNMKLNL